MITIKLDTPIRLAEIGLLHELKIETPMRTKHLLNAMKTGTNASHINQLFFESVCGLPSGGLGELSLEDYARVQEAIIPLMAPFTRLDTITLNAGD